MLTNIARTASTSLILICTSLALFGSYVEAQGPPNLSVCDALSDLERLKGRLVAVHGEMELGTGIYVVMTENRCPSQLVVGGITWPSVIDIAPMNPTAIVEETSRALSDPNSVLVIRQLGEALNRVYASKDHPPFKITATFVGELRTKPLTHFQFAPLYGDGFGAYGAAPAQLGLVAVRDIVVQQIEGYRSQVSKSAVKESE